MKKGFTLVELSLSIVFIAVLSLAVALIITNSISAYHRGLVLNQINTTGMELVDDMRAAIQNAPMVSIDNLCQTRYNAECPDEQSMVAIRNKTSVKIGNTVENGVPVSGTFCTGNYSYIWNSGYYYSQQYSGDDVVVNNGDTSHKIKMILYRKEDGNVVNKEIDDIRLLKFKDEKRMVCRAYSETRDKNKINMTDRDKYDVVMEEPIELLSNSGNLALYDLYSSVPATNLTENNTYYSVSFVLGTLQGGANVMAQGNYCVTPEGMDENASIENFDYCAINKFNFAAEAIGGGE